VLERRQLWWSLDANAKQIVSSNLSHGRDGIRSPFRHTHTFLCGDTVGTCIAMFDIRSTALPLCPVSCPERGCVVLWYVCMSV